VLATTAEKCRFQVVRTRRSSLSLATPDAPSGRDVDTGPALMTLCAITLDCADPLALAAFYAKTTMLSDVDGSDDAFAGLRGPDGLFLGFQRVVGYQAPQWPGQQEPQQAHLDFEVDDLDLAEAAVLQLGACKPAEQPDSDTFRVLTDPAGHPFCLTSSRTVRKRPDVRV